MIQTENIKIKSILDEVNCLLKTQNKGAKEMVSG